ncbi:ComF family protein [Altericroceibacterium spongiae]|uniref:ComF family protein n=2 Tax=Altericroceibacterium spongiae TaxID=2320269 RepID=A0A420ESB8_9SPHN|nr:ComF family protein [Altericroceibacterium spongiae]RKF23614.1 ComF family protein [Altericroceibacterium spongiae]
MIAQALSPIVNLIYPPRCPLCGESMAAQDGLCGPCWSELVIPGEPACTACQRPFPPENGLKEGLCAVCMANSPRHDGITAATLYNDASRRLILAYKHGRRIALADMLARLINARLPPLEGEWLLVPVPLHRWRLWRRGFNQSALLARFIARTRHWPLCVDALERHRRTPVLGGLGKKARARALTGAIRTNPRRQAVLRDMQIILVDDVMTSGATTAACVSALKRAGAKKVRIACFARVLDEALDY